MLKPLQALGVRSLLSLGIFGLGYSVLIFVYERTDDHDAKTGRLDIQHVIFVEASRTGAFQMTKGLRCAGMIRSDDVSLYDHAWSIRDADHRGSMS